MNEYRGTHHTYSSRRSNHQPLGAWKKLSFTLDSRSPDYQISVQRSFQSRHCQAFGYITSNRSIMERTFFSFPVIWFGKRCSSSWTHPKDSSQESYSHCQRHTAYNTPQRNSLERPQYGQSPGSQQRYCLSYLETIQSKTSSNQEIQTQPRQRISRETLRYRRSLLESSRQIDSLLCRREKPDSGTRTDTTITPPSAWYPRKTNSRLYTAWYNNIICSFKRARWYCNWGLPATTQTPGIYQVPADNRHENFPQSGSPSDCRQLWNPQTSHRS